MRRPAFAAIVLLLWALPSAPAGAQQPGPAAAHEAGSATGLVGGTLIDGTGAAPVPDATVVVRDGRIVCAGAAADCPVPEGAREVDVTGRWITPGLIDTHVHYSQTGWADGRPDALDVREEYPYPETIH